MPASPFVRLLLTAGLIILTGCAMYHAAPLPTPGSPRFADLTVDPKTLRFPPLANHRFDPSDGLDSTEIAMLAVANNPELKLARDDAGIAHAQAFAAGLLPNPTISYGLDFPQHTPGATTALNAGIGYDVSALITHTATRDAGQQTARSADLNLLWQEWQVVAQARLLCTRTMYQEKLLRWLSQNNHALAARSALAAIALKAGNVNVDAANASLLAAQDAARQLNELQRQIQQTRADLSALLGLAPGTALNLVEADKESLPSDIEIDASLARLPYRPDLLALQAGYAAQDAHYRQAILAQFPPFNLTLTRARDNTGVPSTGFAVTFSLPIFDRNQGSIAIEKASRQRLFDEYQLRLNSAHQDIARLREEMRLESLQLQTLDAGLPALDTAAAHAQTAFASGDLDGPGYASFMSADVQKHLERETLAGALAEQRLALLTLLGGDFPANTPEPRP